MTLTADNITTLLADQDLLISAPEFDGEIKHLAYNSKEVVPGTLLFIKGNFKPEYLDAAIKDGAIAIVAPQNFKGTTDLPTWISDDVPAAMSIVAMAYYGYPQNDLALIGITGTKGKTSTAYMAYEILRAYTNDKVALSSTLQIITGNEPKFHYRAHLTTPESLDLFRWMREAVDNGMTHMVMEVSSQAFKMRRVYGLRYNVGIFLNISPDHIGENEHPTFADYLAHKMMLFDHSEQIVLNADSDYFGTLIEHAALNVPRDGIWLYGKEDADSPKADAYFEATDTNLHGSVFNVREVGQQAQHLHINGEYTLDMPGDFNQSNALAAMIATRLVGADAPAMVEGLKIVKVPGRMQVLNTKSHGTVYVDYAHNYASIAALLQFVRQNESVNKLTVVVGAPGNKGVSRRPGIGKAVSEGADIVYLTSDDPQYEDPDKIADEIQTAITNPDVTIYRELDRTVAITEAIKNAGPADVVVLAAKGLDEYQKVNGVDTPYENDWAVAQRIDSELEF